MLGWYLAVFIRQGENKGCAFLKFVEKASAVSDDSSSQGGRGSPS